MSRDLRRIRDGFVGEQGRPEIASTILRHQQASAIVSARQIIVVGAAGMVGMALTHLAEKGIEPDDERRSVNAYVEYLLREDGGKSERLRKPAYK